MTAPFKSYLWAMASTLLTCSGETSKTMRSCDSYTNISRGVIPVSLKGMASSVIRPPSVEHISEDAPDKPAAPRSRPVSYTHLRAHETPEHLVCRLLLDKKKRNQATNHTH